MTARAAASTCSAGTPTRGRDPGRLGLVQHRVQLGQLGGDRPGVHATGDVGAVATRLVQHGAAEVAEHHLAGADHPVAGSWWGLAAFSPAATMAKLTRCVALAGCAGRARPRPRPRCARRGRRRPHCNWCGDPVDRGRGPTQRGSTSAASLTARSGPTTPGPLEAGPRQRCWRLDHEAAQVRSPMATVAADPTSPATSATGSSVCGAETEDPLDLVAGLVGGRLHRRHRRPHLGPLPGRPPAPPARGPASGGPPR